MLADVLEGRFHAPADSGDGFGRTVSCNAACAHDIRVQRDIDAGNYGTAVKKLLQGGGALLGGAATDLVAVAGAGIKSRQQRHSGRRLFDVWPQDRTLSAEDVRAFAVAARGWLRFGGGAPPKMRLAVDRLVSSYGPAATGFGFAEPIVDASIALESLYGPFGGRSITRKLAERAGWLLGGADRGRMRSGPTPAQFVVLW